MLKSRDITLPTKVHLVKTMVFPVVMYGCEWKWKSFSCVWFFVTPWTDCSQILNQLSHKGSRRIPKWLVCPFSTDLPNPVIKSGSPALQVDSLPTELSGKIWELDHKEIWVANNWYFWTAVSEKPFESPLDFKEIKPINPKGNQPWIFIGRMDDEASLATWCEDLTHWKRPCC